MTSEEQTKTLPVTSPAEGGEDNDALILQMVAEAQDATPPVLGGDPVVHRGDETQPAPMVRTKTTTAGRKWLWDNRTHERFPILYYMVAAKLKERRLDGSRRFTATEPTEKPNRGTFKCILHPDAPMRAHFDELGLPICEKSNMWNRHGVTLHMQKKHAREWATIEAERLDSERQEDRTERRASTAAMVKIAEGAAGAATPVETETPEPVVPPHPPDDELFQCPKCDLAPFPTQEGLDKHLEKKHPE